MPFAILSYKSFGAVHSVCLWCSHVAYSSSMSLSTSGPSTTPVAISSTMEEIPKSFEIFVADQAALRKPQMHSIA